MAYLCCMNTELKEKIDKSILELQQLSESKANMVDIGIGLILISKQIDKIGKFACDEHYKQKQF